MSKLTNKWVPTGGRKEGGRRVAPMANHWALVAVLGCPRVREHVQGRKGSAVEGGKERAARS
jgi:hypothetical protein